MSSSQIASGKSYDFRKDFRALAEPGLLRFLAVGDEGDDDIDAEQRFDDVRRYLPGVRGALTAAQNSGEMWGAERAAEIAAGFERAMTSTMRYVAEVIAEEAAEAASPEGVKRAAEEAAFYAAEAETERQAIERYAAVDAEAELEALRRVAADPNYLRPFGGGEAYDRQMAKDALCAYSVAEQDRWGEKAIAEFLPLARAARGGADDPSMDSRIDRMAQTFVRKFVGAKIAKAKVEAKAKPEEAEPRVKVRKERPLGSPTPFVWRTPQRREWLHAGHYIRKYVTSTISPGGSGKSSNAIMEALSMVTGMDLANPAGMRLFAGKPLRVWYVNGEDPRNEIDLRLQAVFKHFGIEPDDIGDRLFIDTGREKNFVFALDNGKTVVMAEPLVESVIAGIRTNRIDVLILDPFVAFHLLPESDNTKINQVIKQFAEIADETDASIELVAHTRKANGEAVTVDHLRGASAVSDGSRAVRTVNRMTEAEGEKAKLAPGEFLDIFRLDSGKSNMTKRSNGSTWRRLVSVEVDCEVGAEDVGIVEAWRWPRREEQAEGGREELTPEMTEIIVQAFVKDRLSRRRAAKKSPDWFGYAAMEAAGLDTADRAEKNLMERWLKELVEADVLVAQTDLGPDRHPVAFLSLSGKTIKRLEEASEN